MDKLLELAIEAAKIASDAVMQYYGQPTKIEHKQDDSPLTLADQAAHLRIVGHLSNSGLVIVSEEGDSLHLNAGRYW